MNASSSVGNTFGRNGLTFRISFEKKWSTTCEEGASIIGPETSILIGTGFLRELRTKGVDLCCGYGSGHTTLGGLWIPKTIAEQKTIRLGQQLATKTFRSHLDG